MRLVKFLVSQRDGESGLSAPETMLIDSSDLPGDDWKTKLDGRWRVGIDGRRRPMGFLLGSRGAVVAIRTFEQQATSRWVYVKLMPLATFDDLHRALPYANVDFDVVPGTHINDQQSVDLELDMGLTDVKATEVSATQANRTAIYRVVVGVFDQFIVTVACSGFGAGWSWLEIRDVVSCQLRAIRKINKDG